MKQLLILSALIVVHSLYCQETGFQPIPYRVDIQSQIAPDKSIIDSQWVAVGSKKEHAIGYDFNCLYKAKPSFRFQLLEDDNTLAGYKAGETKGRAELSYCYATQEDVKGLTAEQMAHEILAKTVYHNGKGAVKQGSKVYYRFSLWVPSSLSPDVNTIFAQWHGMPDRTLLMNPQGQIKQISKAEFAQLCQQMTFKKDKGYDKQSKRPNGWMIEQGGYPPLAFGFADKHFYIKANSDRKWLTDKSDRCNANLNKSNILEPIRSTYKSSVIAYREPLSQFPKDRWVTFYITVQWSRYSGQQEHILSTGNLDVMMHYEEQGKAISQHIVKQEPMDIGRNDEDGYYFKFGIYRVGDSTIPVCYNLANYGQQYTPW